MWRQEDNGKRKIDRFERGRRKAGLRRQAKSRKNKQQGEAEGKKLDLSRGK